MSKIWKKKKTDWSAMAVSSDDEIVQPSISVKRHGIKRDTDFNMKEILERANLYKEEYNQEGIHDKVLVLQVMPNDYEMRELTARLELNECSIVAQEEKSGVYGEYRSESRGDMSTSEFCVDTISVHSEDQVEAGEKSVTSLADGAAKDGAFYCSTPKRDPSFCAERFHEPDSLEANLSNARKFGSRSIPEKRERSYDFKPFSSWSESKTERSDIRRKSAEEEHYTREEHKREEHKLDHYSVETNDSTAKDSCEDIDDSGAYSMSEKPIPPPRTIFQDENHGFPENESGLYVYMVKENGNESGSMKCESEFAYGEKTEVESVESATGLDARNETCISVVRKNDSNASASACDVRVLREHRIYVHASWLAVNSRYFRSLLFESGMKECTSEEFSMKVTEVEEDAFLLLLRSIYDPDVLDTVDITTLVNVLRLAVKYDVYFSTKKATRVLEAMPLTLDVCETIIEAVHSGGLPDLGRIMKNVETNLLGEFEPLDETWESEKFASLSEHTLRFLLGSDRLIAQSENTVFIALMQWIAANRELYEDITEYSDLLNLVRFELMKPTYIHDVVRGHEIAMQLDDFDAFYLKAITYHALPQKRRGREVKQRQWCKPKSPTFMWILYPEPEMFSFEDETSSNSLQSSSFWYLGYKMHLQLNLSAYQDESCLYLVVENLVDEGSIEIVYNVDVKFGESLHRSFTCDPFVYQGNDPSSAPGDYPFDEKYTLDEIKEILLGSPIKVAVTFEVTLEKILND